VPLLGTSIYTFACSAGSYGSGASQIRGADGAWFWAAGAPPSCSPCAAGSFSGPGQSACAPCYLGTYSLAGAPVCTPCPAGTYGASVGLATAACSGACATCGAGAWAPASSSSSSLSCVSTGARAAPPSLGLLLWPAAHPGNAQGVDLVVAPVDACASLTSAAACSAAASVTGADGVVRYVVGTAAALHLEAAEALTCAP